MDDLLRLSDIDKSFHSSLKDIKILDKLSLSVGKGSVCSIVGESGCGKSTLCRIITGLERPDYGSVLFNGERMDILKKRSYDNCFDIQYVFQDPYASIQDEATVKAVLDEPLKLCRKYDRKFRSISEVLELVGLEESVYLKCRARELSGGQRQRLSIARALIVNPKLIIADECTSMLDDEASLQICDLFLGLKNAFDTSLLVVTHSVNVVKRLGNQVMILNNGHITDKGTLEDILSSPQTEYSKQWGRCMLRIEGEFYYE